MGQNRSSFSSLFEHCIDYEYMTSTELFSFFEHCVDLPYQFAIALLSVFRNNNRTVLLFNVTMARKFNIATLIWLLGCGVVRNGKIAD